MQLLLSETVSSTALWETIPVPLSPDGTRARWGWAGSLATRGPAGTSRHRACSIRATFCLGQLRAPGFTADPGPRAMQKLSGQGKLSVVVLTSFVVSHYMICRLKEKDGTDIRCMMVVTVCKKSLKLKNKWFLLLKSHSEFASRGMWLQRQLGKWEMNPEINPKWICLLTVMFGCHTLNLRLWLKRIFLWNQS